MFTSFSDIRVKINYVVQSLCCHLTCQKYKIRNASLSLATETPLRLERQWKMIQALWPLRGCPWWSSLQLASAWPNLDCWAHLGVDYKFSLSLPIFLSPSLFVSLLPSLSSDWLRLSLSLFLSLMLCFSNE